MKERFLVFFAGFVQVVLISINTWQLAHEKMIGAFFVGFAISFIWALNVRKIVLGSNWDRFFYALGAGFGSLLGIVISKMIYT